MLKFQINTAQSLCNIAFTLYSKGEILNKAIGGNFHISDSVISDLKDSAQELDLAQVIEILKNTDEVQGLSFEGNNIIFSGFPTTDDTKNIQAWSLLAEAIVRYAEKSHKVLTKKTKIENEKFVFRVWLTRLGLNGSQYKTERNMLYKNLSGYAAFRDEAARNRWLEKRSATHA